MLDEQYHLGIGKDRYHQSQRSVEYPPQARRDLFPNKKAVGVLGMMKAMDTLNNIQESFFKVCWIKSSLACIVLLMKYTFL